MKKLDNTDKAVEWLRPQLTRDNWLREATLVRLGGEQEGLPPIAVKAGLRRLGEVSRFWRQKAGSAK